MRWRRAVAVVVEAPTPDALRLAAREAAYDALRDNHRDDLPTSAVLATYLHQVAP